MDASSIYEERLTMLEAGAFRHLDVEPVEPRLADAIVDTTVPESRGTISNSAHIPIDHAWRDHERGYAPGEMTTRGWVEDVLGVLLQAPNGKLGQCVIVDRVAVVHGLDPTDKDNRQKVSRRVSASLLFLDRVGAVHARERRPATGARTKRPTAHWQLASA